MQEVIVERFGPPEVLKVVERPTPEPSRGEVRVRITSIGMNHAELMARRGEYKLASGDPPFTPGLEAGGVIDAAGEGVTTPKIGERVSVDLDALRTSERMRGGYRSHFVCRADRVVPMPDAVPDEQLGSVLEPYLTAWGCLVWKQQIGAGQFVAIPAASSSVGLAAAQIVRHAGAVAIGLTTSPEKVERIRALPNHSFEHLVVTRERPWHQDLKTITGGRGVDVFFDPVAAGEYLQTEIRGLAPRGVIWVYGLLGKPGTVDVSPLIRKHAAIRGWLLPELFEAGGPDLQRGHREVLDGLASGAYRQHVDRVFSLAEVREAHAYMERGEHVGKLVMVP
jgi:NADPH:quinone reductase-like Zn-dependent oxidoreductase